MERIAMNWESSPVDDVNPMKRLKSDTPCFSRYHSSGRTSLGSAEGETRRLTRELAAARRQLAHMEDTVSQHVEIREKIMKVSESEKNMLKTQLQEAQETIAELREELSVAQKTEAAAQAALSEIKTSMQLQIALLMEQAKLKDSVIDYNLPTTLMKTDAEGVDPVIQGSTKMEPELLITEDVDFGNNSPWLLQTHTENMEECETQGYGEADQKIISNGDKKPEHHSISQRDPMPPNVELSNAYAKINGDCSTSKTKDSVELGKRMEESTDDVCVLQEILKNPEHPSTILRRGKDTSVKNTPFVKGKGKITEFLSLKQGTRHTRSAGGETDFRENQDSSTRASNPGGFVNQDSHSDNTVNKQKKLKHWPQKGDKLKLVEMGKYYCYLVSERFFQIDWDDEYGKGKDMFACRTCNKKFNCRPRMEEHVWRKHYKGTFFCPHCPQNTGGLSARPNIAAHSKLKHPTLFDSEAFKENLENVCRILK